jgi:hypothetical protein
MKRFRTFEEFGASPNIGTIRDFQIGDRVIVFNGIAKRPTWTMATAGEIIEKDQPYMTFGSSTTGGLAGFTLLDDEGNRVEYESGFNIVEDTPENRDYLGFPRGATNINKNKF